MRAEQSRDGAGPLITYTLFPNAFPVDRIERADVPWHDLCAKIHDAPTYISKRHCPLISLAAYGETLTENNCIRHAANVLRVYGVEIDYDGEHVTPEQGAELLRAAGLRAIVYTSPSHVDGAPRWRALLPLSEPAAPSLRTVYVARANRALGGLATRESFTLSQSFYIGKVRGGTYRVIETDGRCIDEAADLEPLYYTGHVTNSTGRDMRSDAELRRAFEAGEGRYEAMLKLSSRWAARGMEADDIAAALHALLGNSPMNADGIDLRTRIEPLATSAVAKYGGQPWRPFLDLPEPPPAEVPPVEAYADLEGEPVEDTPKPAAEKLPFRHIGEIIAERREPVWLLHKVLEANVLAVLAGPRGSFKSFVALDWSMRIAEAGTTVLMLSGEGAGLDRRADAWMRTHGQGRSISEFPLYALERPVNLRLAVELEELSQAIKALPSVPGLIVVDTFSKFSAGIDENDNGEVAAFLAGLTDALRLEYGCSVLVVAHSGHADPKRPRGASALMANPDAEYIIERPVPTGMQVTVSRERFKDGPALEPLGYEALSVDLGRVDSYGEPVTSLALISCSAPSQLPKEVTGKVQRQLMAGLRNLQRDSKTRLIWSMPELRSVARSSGASKQAAQKAVESVVMAGFLSPVAGGGYSLRIDEGAVL